MITADFNINFTHEVPISPEAAGAVGSCRLEGVVSEPVDEFLALVDTHDLIVPQTFGLPGEAMKIDICATWLHPATRKPQVKDFVLLPSAGSRVLRRCRPNWRADMLSSDHAPMICNFLKQNHPKVIKASCKWEQLNVKRTAASRGGRPCVPLRDLDLYDSDRHDAYAKAIADAVNVPPGWKCTEQLMKSAARKHLRPVQSVSEHWCSGKAAKMLEQKLHSAHAVQHQLHVLPPVGKKQQQLRKQAKVIQVKI
jgi:hypothetical protein